MTFLSAIVRTQGSRPRALLEALESLAAQTDDDLEVIVVVHGDASSFERVAASVSDNVRVLSVDGGKRAAPLNVGLHAASAEYVAFLDDDDLALPSWVSTFRLGANRSSGRVIRIPCLSQWWTGDERGQPIEATTEPHLEFSPDFDLIAHFHSNATPICAMALPRRALSEAGLRFDEQLPVLEDWDLFLRAVLACGIENITDPPGSIYRRVERGNSSDHADDDWRAAKERIIARLDADPLVLPPGSATRLSLAYQARLDLSYQLAERPEHPVQGRRWPLSRRT